jgi:hypothetical protein
LQNKGYDKNEQEYLPVLSAKEFFDHIIKYTKQTSIYIILHFEKLMRMKNFTLSMLALCAVLFSYRASAQIPAGASVQYLFSNNYADSSGNALHGTGNGTFFVTDRWGKPNSACFFNGFASVNTPYMPANLTGLTISLWVKNSLTQNPFPTQPGQFIAGFRHQTFGASPSIGLDYAEPTGSYTFGYNNANVWEGKRYVYNNNFANWTHLTVVWQGGGTVDASQFTLYVNAVPIITAPYSYNPTSQPLPSTPLTTLETFILGTCAPAYYNGIIDDVIVYERALSPIQVDSVFKDDPNCKPVVVTQHPSNKTVCQGTNASFSAAGTFAFAYQWQEYKNGIWSNITPGPSYSGTTSNTLTVVNPSVSFNQNQYRCLIRNVCNGFATTDPATLIVDGINNDPLSVTVTSTATRICKDKPATFEATVTNGGNLTNYQWRINGIDVPGATTQSFTTTSLNSSDKVSCSVTRINACMAPVSATSNAITVIVNQNITPFVYISSNPSTPVSPFTTITFTTNVTAGGDNPSFQWMLNGNDIPDATNDTFTTYTLADNDEISVKMVSNDPCTTKPEAVSNKLKVRINTEVNTALGQANIEVYPNPVHDVLTVRTECSNCSATITDVTGRVLQTVSLQKGANSIDVKALQPGMYILKYTDGNTHEAIRISKQ